MLVIGLISVMTVIKVRSNKTFMNNTYFHLLCATSALGLLNAAVAADHKRKLLGCVNGFGFGHSFTTDWGIPHYNSI